MSMTPDQIALARDAFSGMKAVSIAAPQPHSTESLSDLLLRNDVHNASINFHTLTATGFSRGGLKAVAGLARTFRPAAGQNSYKASNATLAKFIAGEIVNRWRGRQAGSLTSTDFDELETAIDDWFASQTEVRQHVVPCTLFPYPIASFAVGPVTFYHLRDFPTESFGISHDEFWPKPLPPLKRWTRNAWAAIRGRPVAEPKPGGFHFEQMINLAVQRHAPWVALVDVPGRALDESINTADIAADIALAAIQLVCPGDDTRRLSRATGRASPVWRVDLSRGSAGGLSSATRNLVPALARSPEFVVTQLNPAKPLLDSMSRRLSAYLAATSSLPDLDEAWCNAAYWYHEALAESLDTVAVAKLETAIEVLFRAESMSGSKKRLLDSFDAIFGLASTDQVNPPSPVTVEQLVVAITTARSRVLHGTWPTLHNDLPIAKGKPAVTYADVEVLTRMLLLEFSDQVDAYQKAGQTEDKTEALVTWIKAERVAKQAATTSSGSV